MHNSFGMKNKHKFFWVVLMLFALSHLNAQEVVKKIPDDNYGITYDAVFDNMHYNQPYRPQVHYTPITGQIGDATGMVLYKGAYHLFHMYDEWSRTRKFNKNWGHAVTRDLIHWSQEPQVLNTVLDNRPGSGSGIVDWNNTLGLQSGPEKTMVIFYTDYGRGTCIAFSRDAGKTWIRHKANPVIPMPEGNGRPRDALVFWYKPDQSWRLVLYEQPGFTFYKSTNLLDWDYLSKIEEFFECPDFMEMPVDGNTANKKWVIIDGNGGYRIGDFDGKEFRSSDRENRNAEFGGDLYATQTWKHSYEGDGPFVQMGMIRMDGKQAAQHDRTWNNQQCFPSELTLETINGEVRLCRNPVTAIKDLRYDSKFWKNQVVNLNQNPLADLDGDVFEIIAEIELTNASGFSFDFRGEKVTYTRSDNVLTLKGKKATVPLINNRIMLRFIVDRSSIEVFANRGEVTFSNLFWPEPSNRNLGFSPVGGSVRIISMEAYRLRSIWLGREQELGYYRPANN